MQLATRLRPALIACAVLAPLSARADVSADGAAQLEQRIHDWIAGLLGPKLKLPPLPLHVTADGDHYRIATDISGPVFNSGYSIDHGAIVATTRPLDGDRWSIDSFGISSPLAVTNPTAAPHMPRSWTLDMAKQATTGVLDTSLATTSNLDSDLDGYSVVTEVGHAKQITRFDTSKTHSIWEPAPDGRLNMSSEGTTQKMAILRARPDETGSGGAKPGDSKPQGPDVEAKIDKVATSMRLESVDLSKFRQIIPNAVVLGLSIIEARKAGAPDNEGVPPSLRPVAHDLLLALGALAKGAKEEATADGIKVTAAGHSASLARVHVGAEVGAPENRLVARMHLALDGLDSPEVPNGVIRDYLPRHISVTPRISGIPADDVMHFLLDAVDAGGKEPEVLQGEAVALLAKGPLEIGIEELALDLGPATLKGIGALEIPSPDAVTGKAEITMTGLDELIKRANSIPQFKQGVPVLIFLKGIGEQKADATVWRIVYDTNSVQVNDNDLSQLMPGK